MTILRVEHLSTSFTLDDRSEVQAVRDVSFDLHPGTTLGIVGESGCGKSVTALSILRLLPQPAGKITNGSIYFKEQDLLKLSPDEMWKIRGHRISMIFQEPMTALNPVKKVKNQIAEVLQIHFPNLSTQEVQKECVDLLQKVGIPEPVKRLQEYPHQLSGGMRQRVMIAMALACKPDILVADEPTTALDVTIQAQILDLLKAIQEEMNMALILITHDLGVVAEVCDEVIVMYAGEIVERADVVSLFESPQHPYTIGLLKSIPSLATKPKSKLVTIEGSVPSLSEMPVGCRFQGRCAFVIDSCRKNSPNLTQHKEDHLVRCFRAGDLK